LPVEAFIGRGFSRKAADGFIVPGKVQGMALLSNIEAEKPGVRLLALILSEFCPQGVRFGRSYSGTA
jgi:hypothetical protein